MTRLTFLAAACLFSMTEAAGAGTIADKAAEAEAAIAADDTVTAWTAAGAISEEVWNTAQAIGFTTVSLATERSVGFGIYNPRENNQFKEGEPVIIYAEPWGYAYGSAGEGLHSVNLAVDLEIMTEAGESLGSVKDVAALDLVSRSRLREFNATVMFNLGGVKEGKYLLKITFRDKNSEKTGGFDMPIEIVK